MSLIILDTDHITLFEKGNARVLQNIIWHVADVVVISVITVEEQLEGWQRALRRSKNDAQREAIYLRMAQAVECLAGWPVIPNSQAAMGRRAALLRMRLNVGSNDLKIAAIALECQATVVTRNIRDFGRVPGLTLVDWSV